MNTKHTAWTCASAVVLGSLLPLASNAIAQPGEFTDLGARLEPELLVLPIHLRSRSDVQWFRIELPGASDHSGFVDLWTIPPLQESPLVFPGVGVYSAQGQRVTVSTNVTEWNQAWLTFGLTDPRAPVTMPNIGTADPIPAPPFDGMFGPLPPGEYWLAVVRGGASFGATNWDVRSTGDAGEDRDTVLYLRIQPPDVPYCDADFNWDGNVDQDDVLYLANVLAGGDNPTGRWADYNRDGNEDQDDLLALVHTIAGGGCPE